MSASNLYVLIGGCMLIAWAGYQLIRFYRKGEISAVNDVSLSAYQGDPALWRWFIAIVNVIYFAGGTVLIAVAFLR